MTFLNPRVFLACVLVLATGPAPALLAATRASFDKAVKDVQMSPYDEALRRKLFKIARETRSLPEIPDEVAILKGKAAYIVKNAESSADYIPAVDAYQRATELAPWVPGLYYNLGIVQEKAGRPADATASFKLYLAADPDAEDRDKVLSRLGALEVQQEQKAQSITQAAASGSGRSADPAALRRWEGQKAGQIAVGVVGGLGLGLGAVLVGVGLGESSGALYTTSPGYSKGVLYNKYYEGKYWSSASYKQYTEGQATAGAGWVMMAVGGLGIVIALVMDPGPKPTVAMLELQDGSLHLALPPIRLNPQMDGLQLSLLNATF